MCNVVVSSVTRIYLMYNVKIEKIEGTTVYEHGNNVDRTQCW